MSYNVNRSSSPVFSSFNDFVSQYKEINDIFSKKNIAEENVDSLRARVLNLQQGVEQFKNKQLNVREKSQYEDITRKVNEFLKQLPQGHVGPPGGPDVGPPGGPKLDHFSEVLSSNLEERHITIFENLRDKILEVEKQSVISIGKLQACSNESDTDIKATLLKELIDFNLEIQAKIDHFIIALQSLYEDPKLKSDMGEEKFLFEYTTYSIFSALLKSSLQSSIDDQKAMLNRYLETGSFKSSRDVLENLHKLLTDCEKIYEDVTKNYNSPPSNDVQLRAIHFREVLDQAENALKIIDQLEKKIKTLCSGSDKSIDEVTKKGIAERSQKLNKQLDSWREVIKKIRSNSKTELDKCTKLLGQQI